MRVFQRNTADRPIRLATHLWLLANDGLLIVGERVGRKADGDPRHGGADVTGLVVRDGVRQRLGEDRRIRRARD